MRGKVHNRKNGEAGFSLIELLITLVVSGFLLLLMVRLGRTASFIVGNVKEEAAMGEQRASLSDMWRYDFDMAGYNLVRPVQPSTGTEIVTFSPTAGYNTSSGSAMRTDTSSGAIPISSTRGIGAGNGSVAFTLPGDGSTVVMREAGGGAWGIGVAGSSVTLYSNGAAFAPSAAVPPHTSGDGYRVDLLDNTIRYLRVRGGTNFLLETLALASGDVTYPVALVASVVGPGQQVSATSITGSLLETLSGTTLESAQMPFYNGNRLSGPVHLVSASDVILFGGDEQVDPALTAASFAGGSGASFIQFVQPRRGGIKSSDVVMLLDRDARGARSPLYRVLAVTPASPAPGTLATLTVERVLSANPAYGVIYSDAADSAATFAAESSIVKVLPPVRYRIANGQFVRQQGGSPETVALGAVSFNVSLLGTSPLTYRTTLELTGEGREASSDSSVNQRNVIQYDATPRSLNLTSNKLN